MAAEVTGELSKAQKRELKWDRKQAKLKAAAEAAGQPYIAPSKKEKEASVDKLGKRKKRKLASLGQDEGQPATNGTVGSAVQPRTNGSPAEPAVIGMTENSTAMPLSKEEKKKAKKAKRAAAASDAAAELPALAAADPDTQPKKKKKKSSDISTAAPSQSAAIEAATISKASKKSKGVKGKVTVHQVGVG